MTISHTNCRTSCRTSGNKYGIKYRYEAYNFEKIKLKVTVGNTGDKSLNKYTKSKRRNNEPIGLSLAG